MLVEQAGDAAHERHGDEHCREDDGDADHRRRDFLHRRERSLPGRLPLLDVTLDRLHHHDGVVDHETDGEDETEQRERIHREAEHREQRERSDQRDRHRDQWNQGRAPALQEQEDHQRYQQGGLEQRDDDLANALGHGDGGVERRDVVEVGGEPRL